MILLPILTSHIFSFEVCENVLFELGSERVNFYSKSPAATDEQVLFASLQRLVAKRWSWSPTFSVDLWHQTEQLWNPRSRDFREMQVAHWRLKYK